ncbi:type II toxin-antitoxin system VapC family toxin [Microbacterium album]|uniref:Ribonuclease VapC n=1 Tax=Microbacterium album TaxID=2053191 RepID=A0A917IJA2_9MICO|nr:type II toxin-antitoxin system VapC family toxin [Microbacterium album]GGH50309.1 hypothetical protein GCM10010921_28980 [Microbacterium album]
MSSAGVVVDANVIIALLDARDATHEQAAAVLRTLVGRPKHVHPLTLSEVLVHPARRGGREEAALQRAALARAGFAVIDEGAPSPEDIAVARSRGLRMPDAVVLASALSLAVPLVTFDRRLASAARDGGVPLIDGAAPDDKPKRG